MCKMHFCVLADLSIMKKMREALSTMYIMDQITEMLSEKVSLEIQSISFSLNKGEVQITVQ